MAGSASCSAISCATGASGGSGGPGVQTMASEGSLKRPHPHILRARTLKRYEIPV